MSYTVELATTYKTSYFFIMLLFIIMNTKEIRNYLKTIKFGLRDFGKTNAKYQNYKVKESRKILDSQEMIESFFQFFTDNLQYAVIQYPTPEIEMLGKEKSKANIRYLKTLINRKARGLLKEFVENVLDYEEIDYPKSHKFDTRFYLAFYNRINEEMKEVLEEIIFSIE